MAYIIGLIDKKEKKELERRGWEMEEPPKELIPKMKTPGKKMWMVWVDSSMFEVMNGEDWQH